MSSYRPDQRRLTHRGRAFHFVSYEGHPADPRREVEAQGPTWFLMGPNKRWPVMPQVDAHSDDEVDVRLRAWLETNVFA